MATTTTNADAKFWNRISAKYARSPVPDEDIYAQKLEITRRYLTASSQVLEVGCGTGTTAIHHAPHAAHIRATDFSDDMLAIARQKAEAAGVTNVTFETVSVEDLTVEDGSYDMVMAHSLLHLVKDRGAILKTLNRALKPGGILITSTACLGDNLWFFRYIAPIGKALRLLPVLKVFTADQLATDIEALGLRTEHRWQPGNGHTLFLVSRKAVPA